MKKNRFAVVTALVCFVFLLAGCAGKAPAAPDAQESAEQVTEQQAAAPAEQADSQTQNAPAGATIAVEMPEGWLPVEGSSVYLQYQKVTHSFIVKTEQFTATTLDGVVEEALAIYRQSFGDITIESGPEPVTVGGLDARSLTFTCVVSDMDMKYRFVYAFVGDALYTFTFGDLANSFDSLAEEYDSILASVKIG